MVGAGIPSAEVRPTAGVWEAKNIGEFRVVVAAGEEHMTGDSRSFAAARSKLGVRVEAARYCIVVCLVAGPAVRKNAAPMSLVSIAGRVLEPSATCRQALEHSAVAEGWDKKAVTNFDFDY